MTSSLPPSSSPCEENNNGPDIMALGDDPTIRILEFLSDDDEEEDTNNNLVGLKSLAFLNKNFCRLICEDPRTNTCLFGKNRNRQYWKNIYNLRELVTDYMALFRSSFRRKSRALNRLGVLPSPDERSSLHFDHQNILGHRPGSCSGYFGFLKFPIEVAVWGDYSGVSFLPTLDTFLNPKPNQVNGTLFGTSYQVMAVATHKDLLFLGFASGEVRCISMDTTPSTPSSSSSTATHTPNGDQQKNIIIEDYPELSAGQFHTSEVSSLSTFGERNLVSACMTQGEQNKVMIHWGALEDGNLDRTYQFAVGTTSIFSMASTTLFGMTLLQIGGDDKTIISTAWNGNGDPQEDGREEQSQHVGSTSGHIVFLKYVGRNKYREQCLLVGLGSGEVVFFEHEDPTTEQLLDLSLAANEIPDFFARGHLEAAELVGDVLIMAGGSSGEISFYNLKDHIIFGSLAVHPGVQFRGHQGRLQSAVVGLYFSHERGSLISLCRDGHVNEIFVEEELQRAKAYEKECNKRKKRARRPETDLLSSRPGRRRTRSQIGHS